MVKVCESGTIKYRELIKGTAKCEKMKKMEKYVTYKDLYLI